MNRSYILMLAGILFTGCDKNQPAQTPGTQMKYVDLHQSEVKMGSTQRIDLDGDGTIDFAFKTELIGDPIMKRDRVVFEAASGINTYLLNIDNTETTKRLDKGSLISNNPPSGYEWFQIALAVLTEKIVPESAPAYWEGEWKNASHHYLPVLIAKNNRKYLGWIEVSMDIANEKMILHQGAISVEDGKETRAGY